MVHNDQAAKARCIDDEELPSIDKESREAVQGSIRKAKAA